MKKIVLVVTGILLWTAMGSLDSVSAGRDAVRTHEADVAALKAAIADFTEAYNRADVNAVINTFDENLVYMPKGKPTKVGKQAIDSWQAGLEATFAKNKTHLE